MAEKNKVQLKQEELVGDEIVLSDINPVSNTKSINDSSNGATLEKTIARMWQSINGKLSRVVNSVNGRTGVVVLTADDVGLGNVDNVSFAEIKKWATEKLSGEFGSNQIYLAESLDEIEHLISTNNMKYNDTPFYAEKGHEGDLCAHIGYITYDESVDMLKYWEMPISTVGKTNNSLIYNEKIGTDPNKDMSGGGLGINIYKYEDALYLYNDASGNKSESGLRIDKSKIANNFYFFDGLYGSGSGSQYDFDNTALLSRQSDVTTLPIVNISIDGIVVKTDYPLHMSYGCTSDESGTPNKIKVGDLIYTNFKFYDNNSGNSLYNAPAIPVGMESALMGRAPAIGMVTSEPHPDSNGIMINEYLIKFVSIKPNLGWGLQSITNHNDASSNCTDTQISLKLASGFTDDSALGANMSGLQVSARPNMDPSLGTPKKYAIYNSKNDNLFRYSVTPSGSQIVYKDSSNNGGLFITPDMSLCIQPQRVYGQKTTGENCSDAVANWNTISPARYNYAYETENGMLTDQSLIGINLAKFIVKKDSKRYYVNCSGLRLMASTDKYADDATNATRRLTPDFFGCCDTNEMNTNSGFDITASDYSGGLSINVGDFLEIGRPEPAVTTSTSTTTSDFKSKADIEADINSDLASFANYAKYVHMYCYYKLDGSYPANVTDAELIQSKPPYIQQNMSSAVSIMNQVLDKLKKYAVMVRQSQTDYRDTIIQYIGYYNTGLSNISSTDTTLWTNVGTATSTFAQNVTPLYDGIYDYGGSTTTTSTTTSNPFFGKNSDEYFDTGKINVRIGAGLTNVSNRITLNIKPNGGLAVNSLGQVYVSNYSGGTSSGGTGIEDAVALKITGLDSSTGNTNEMVYDPSKLANNVAGQPYEFTISAGAGLKLTWV